MQQHIYRPHIFLFAILFCAVMISACKKEIEQLKRPYNDIQSFTLAGYAGIDSLHAAIDGNDIVINWLATAAMPTKIKPVIAVSSGATIQPASGTEIELKNGASYTVTAEDGTTRTFKIKVNAIQAIPKLLTVVNATGLSWLESTVIGLTGEYFLASGDTSAIKVYLQRKRDGVELDMPVVKTLVRQTSLRVNLPEFNAACDTGMHKIWLKVGDQASQGIDVYLPPPPIRNTTNVTSLAENGQTVAPGQTLKINYNMTDTYGGAITRYYQGKFNTVIVNIRKGTAITSFTATNVQDNKSVISFTIPASATAYSGYEITQINVFAPRPVAGTPTATDLFNINPTGTKIQ